MAKTCWYDATPIGRIVNRFSQDILIIDRYVLHTMLTFIKTILASFQVIFVIAVSIPFLFPFMIPIVWATRWISKQYVFTSREIKRLESVFKSPVFVLFSESLQGLSIIRSFQVESRFLDVCCKRVINTLIHSIYIVLLLYTCYKV